VRRVGELHPGQSTVGPRPRIAALAVVAVLAGFPAMAQAHGPSAPIATSDIARVAQLPVGTRAKVIDGDQRLWLSVAPRATLIVLDYRGTPYLRFTASGVDVNRNSAMYYLNLNPSEAPPPGVRPATPPNWSRASTGHTYSWHDERLHALATVATAPGESYMGRWSIPVRVDGRPSVIAGGLWRADAPSLVWFWAIVVLDACMFAAWRLKRLELDLRLARWFSVAALAGIVVAAIGRELHGRPTISAFQLITLAIFAAFVIWAARRLVQHRATYFTYFAIGFVAIWQGINLIPTLLHGFVLAAVPPSLVRVACVVCLGCGIAMLVLPLRMVSEAEPDDELGELVGEDEMLSESRV
jgi:uncharacterized membrane protein YqjE